MSLDEKYNLDLDNVILVKSLPKDPQGYLYILPDDYDYEYSDDRLYINRNGKLHLIVYKASTFYYLLVFLKKYRANPELLPKDLKHEYPDDDMSSEEIYKAMQLMLKPMNSFEEFKERLLLATKELSSVVDRNKYITRFGEKLVFVNKKEDCGTGINIYGEVIPILQKYGETYWEEAILFDKEKKIFELWYEPERTNRTPDNSHWKLEMKFYEEQYLYEYLLNKEINAIRS